MRSGYVDIVISPRVVCGKEEVEMVIGHTLATRSEVVFEATQNIPVHLFPFPAREKSFNASELCKIMENIWFKNR